MKVALISTYDLGHQPFGLASPTAWLRARGADVACIDLAVQDLSDADVEYLSRADAVAFYLPMHTATRIAAEVITKVRSLNPNALLCAYGLYAPMNATFLRKLGIQTVLGGEFEQDLVAAIFPDGHCGEALKDAQAPIPKLKFLVPDRTSLLDLDQYAILMLPDGSTRKVGYTEATRGCKHLCRHCPIVPVYDGQFRVVQRDVVMADIDQLVAAGAEHISFGDPDFFNGTRHAVEIVSELHRHHPKVSYDVTIKIEHLVKHVALLPLLRDTGCAFVTSAVESVDDRILDILQKGHTRSDLFKVVSAFRDTGLTLSPTFVAFTPWITLEGYRDLLQCIAELDLIENVAPVQYGIRLLLPEGSRLFELAEMASFVTGFDETALCYRWKHPDPLVDALQKDVESAVKETLRLCGVGGRAAVFDQVWKTLGRYLDLPPARVPDAIRRSTAACRVPHLSEAWYCCAEPTEQQMRSI